MSQSKFVAVLLALTLVSLALPASTKDPNNSAEPTTSPAAAKPEPVNSATKTTSIDPKNNPFNLDPSANAKARPEPIRKRGPQRETSREEKQFQAVLEAVNTRRFPERLSVYAEPLPFNLTHYERDPDDYLDVVEPGRVYQTARPDSDAPVLRILGQPAFALAGGERATLQVQSVPGYPVTFHAPRGGGFEGSGLCTVTVVADSQGVARATYFIKANSPGDTAVIVGSPMAIGNVSFPIHVRAGGDR